MTETPISSSDVSSLFPPLPPTTHKYEMGRVLCVCGSYNGMGSSMCGAAYFSAAAAYRTGAGIVEIFTERKNYESLAARIPEAVFSLYDTEKETADSISTRLSASLQRADSVILGCGLGMGEASKELVRQTLTEVDCPLVIDADGLNILAQNKDCLALLSDKQKSNTVITPHIGEMSRLCGVSSEEILKSPRDTAIRVAKELGVVCLLKGHRTVITDGKDCFINASGNPGMATAGSGDVLSGIIGALLARNTVAAWLDEKRCSLPGVLFKTAVAAYIHGLAGDGGARKIGTYSLMASDILGEIPSVIHCK